MSSIIIHHHHNVIIIFSHGSLSPFLSFFLHLALILLACLPCLVLFCLFCLAAFPFVFTGLRNFFLPTTCPSCCHPTFLPPPPPSTRFCMHCLLGLDQWDSGFSFLPHPSFLYLSYFWGLALLGSYLHYRSDYSLVGHTTSFTTCLPYRPNTITHRHTCHAYSLPHAWVIIDFSTWILSIIIHQSIINPINPIINQS